MKSNKNISPFSAFLFVKNVGIKTAFTLVELIVVIVILAILATIAFLSFNNYSSSARDSTRLSDITNISKGLELFQIKAGIYPVPLNPTYYTGGANGLNIIQQGTINGNLIGFSKSSPTDPLNNTPYIYSTSGDSKYYQIYSELENITSYNSIKEEGNNNIAYADNTNSKQTLIKGNYLFDPSLPSLIVIPGSIPTTVGSGGIFSPDVCFVTNQSTSNILSNSTSNNCIKKKLANLNTIDSSLVGYWDMETTTGGLLKDLSGNGNNGIFSGGMVYSSALTGGIIGKGLLFDGNLNQVYINSGNQLNINGSVTVSSLVRIGNINKTTQVIIFRTGNYAISYNGLKYIRLGDSNGNGFNSNYLTNINNSIYYNIVGIYDNTSGLIKIYINGQLFSSGKPDSGNNWYNSGTNTGILSIGAYYSSTTQSFSGIIDDIKIYNRILSDIEIKQQAKIAGF